jgi:hypothetical protein
MMYRKKINAIILIILRMISLLYGEEERNAWIYTSITLHDLMADIL